MTTEWKEIANPEDLFRLKREGWEIEFQTARGEWVSWAARDWPQRWIFRARPRQPKMKKVKYECYDINGILSWLQQGRSTMIEWIRQPHLDLEGEVPE